MLQKIRIFCTTSTAYVEDMGSYGFKYLKDALLTRIRSCGVMVSHLLLTAIVGLQLGQPDEPLRQELISCFGGGSQVV